MADAIRDRLDSQKQTNKGSAELHHHCDLTSSDLQLQSMGKLSLHIQDEQTPQRPSFSSSSFVNTHLSLTKVVRLHVHCRFVQGGFTILRLGRVSPSRLSPWIQQTETDSSFGFLLYPNFRGDIRLLFTRPSYSRRRIPRTPAATG